MTKQGDNIVAVDQDAFKRHVAKISAKKIAKDAADAEYKTARQEAKAGGITLGSLDQAIKLANMNRDERDQAYAEVSQYAIWLGAVEIGSQLDMFNHAGPGPADLEKAYGAGEMAGLTGEDPHGGKHAPGSEQYNKWMEGWHAGSAIFQEESAAVGVEPLGPDDTEEPGDDADKGNEPPMPYYVPPDDEKTMEPEGDADPALVDRGANNPEPFDPDADVGMTDVEQAKSYKEGWEASESGAAQSECPYETGDPDRGFWLQGFDAERASQK